MSWMSKTTVEYTQYKKGKIEHKLSNNQWLTNSVKGARRPTI